MTLALSDRRRSKRLRAAPRMRQTLASGRTTAPVKIPRWMYGYGLFQGSAVGGDSLVLFFGAAVLSVSPAVIGLLDAVGSIAFTVGAAGLAFLLPRIRGSGNLFVLSLVGVGATLALFATVNSTPLALALAMMFGLLLAPSSALAPVMATKGVPRSLWSEAFSHLNQVSSVGGAVGIAAAALWLAGSHRLGPPDVTVKLLFIGIGTIAVLSSLLSYMYLLIGGRRQQVLADEDTPSGLSWQASSASDAIRAKLPLLSDQLVYYLIFTFILFAGFGMSFSGMHTYLIQDLRASVALAMGTVLGFRLMSFFVSRSFSQGIAQLLPLQVLSLTSLGRGASVALLVAVGVFLPASFGVPVALLLVALWGISGGALAVAGTETTALMAVRGRWTESMALYVAVSNAGYLTGAWGGGVLATQWGFEAMFLVSAGLMGLGALLLLRN